MLTPSRNRPDSSNLPPARRSSEARARRTRARASGGIAVFICLCGVGFHGASASADEARLAFIEADDGFTRESVSVINRAEPARPSASPAANAVAPPTSRFQAVSRHHHRRVHRHALAQQAPPTKTVLARDRRNFVVKFVWWWNGLVIKNFHTKIGTVALGTVGAES